MQTLLMEAQPRKRKPKTKKPVSSVTYRVGIEVKLSLEEMAEKIGRSENLQMEYCVKVAYLHYRGVNLYGMNDLQVVDKFDEITTHLKDRNE